MHNARDFLYYYDSTDTASGWRRRWYLVPAETDTIETVAPFPAYGESPAPESGWRRMPDGAIGFSEPGEAGFAPDGLPVGVPNAASRKITLRHDIASQLDGLAATITDYIRELPFNGSSGEAHVAKGANLWTETCDMGDDTLAWDQFTTVFQGVQRLLPEKPGVIIPGRRVVQEIDLYEVTAYCLEAVTMKMVCAENVTARSIDGPTDDRVYDTIYEDSNSDVVAITNDQVAESVEMFTAGSLYLTMSELCNAFYLKLLRGAFTWSTAPQVLGFVGDPFSHIDFYNQDYTDALGRGSTIVSPFIEGIIWTDASTGSVSPIGGLLIEQKDDADTFATDRTCLEWLRAECEGLICRATVNQTSPRTIFLRFTGVLTSPKTAVDITRADIVLQDYDGDGGIEFAESGNAISNARIAILTTGSEDINEAESKAFGFRVEKGFQAQLSLHNVPNVGDGGADAGSTPYSDIPGAKLRRRTLYAWYNLYYYDNPLGAAIDIPIRVHHNCTIRHSATVSTTTGHTTPVLAPTKASMDAIEYAAWRRSEDWPTINAAVLQDLVALLYTIQNEGGLANGVAKSYTDIFSQAGLTRYTITLPATLAGYNDIGRIYNIMPLDANLNHSAQALADTDDVDLTHLYGSCQLIHVKPYVGYDTSGNEGSDGAEGWAVPLSECTFLGLSF